MSPQVGNGQSRRRPGRPRSKHPMKIIESHYTPAMVRQMEIMAEQTGLTRAYLRRVAWVKYYSGYLKRRKKRVTISPGVDVSAPSQSSLV